MNLFKIKKTDFFLTLFSALASISLVYNYLYKFPPTDVTTYFDILKLFNSNLSLLGFNILNSFDLGYFYLYVMYYLGEFIFMFLYTYILTQIFKISFKKISNNLIIIILNLLVLMIPEYLPSKFITSTFRQTISLFFFLIALNQSNTRIRNIYFLFSVLGHFTGILNIVCLIISKYFLSELKLNKYAILSLFSTAFILIFYSDLFSGLSQKLDHYTQIQEINFTITKKITLAFIFFICTLDFTIFKKLKSISSFIFIYIFIIIIANNISDSIAVRLFNSIYFIFPIYCISLFWRSFTLRSLYDRN